MTAPRPAPDDLPLRMADPADPLFALVHSPFYWVARVSGRHGLDMGAALRRVGLDVPRWRVLMILRERDSASISAIADEAVIKLSTVTRMVQRLRIEGLVVCSARASDARVTEVRLTPAGVDVLEEVRRQASAIFRQGLAGVSSQELSALISLLQRLFYNLETPAA